MIGLILTLALVGLIVWLVITYIPMPQPIKTAIIVIVVVMMILYLVRILGIADISLERIR